MARENQGLQIALIIFFMLTIILGVTTFLFFRQYEESDRKAADAEKKAATDSATARAIQEECNQLKEYMGCQPTQKIDEVTAQFNKDMQDYGSTFSEANPNYHNLLIYLFQTIGKRNTELADLKDENQDLKDERERLDQVNAAKVKPLENELETARGDVKTVTDKAATDRQNIEKARDDLHAQLQDAKKRDQAQLDALAVNLKTAQDSIDNLSKQNRRKAEKIEEFVKETFEVPDGEIRWVNQHNRTVWIDLGRADSLRRQITFSVYPIDTTNLTKSGKKASIEVTQLLGEHRAEARIIEDKISDPIMPGDKIHTPVWSPGEQKRFALAGFMDIDGDDKSDQHTVRMVIEMNGGIIDAWADEKTGEPQGKITENTRYLVVGTAPDAKSPDSVTEGFSSMMDDAEKYGIQKIPVADLLQQMGWKNQTPVIRFGRGANPKDFRARPAEGVPKVSTGNVSEVFRPRRPPPRRTMGRGGAY